MLLIGSISTAGYIFISLAFKYGEASKLAMFLFLDLVVMCFADNFIFHESFSVYDFVGIPLLVLALLGPIVYAMKQSSNKKQDHKLVLLSDE